MSDRYFEDFKVGDVFRSEGLTITESEIISFAMKYDPQSFHLDVEAARDSVFGGLAASGFHTLAVTFRQILALGLFRASNIAGQGLDEVRWVRPVRPGDTLYATIEIVAATPSDRKPDRGYLRIRYVTTNHQGEEVMTLFATHVVKRRGEV